jgi:drug/metabolite transporter (DMT)-like permease
MNETIRTYIRRRVWWCLGVGFAGWLLIPLGGVIAKSLPTPLPVETLSFAGVLVFAGAMLVMQRIVKCPKCSAKLGRTIAMPLAFSWGSGPKIGFCPYCGVNLDEPLPGAHGAIQTQNPIS